MNATILIIEDDNEWAAFLSEKLSGVYNILTAESGSKGLAFLKEQQINAVLLDLGLPDYKNAEDLSLLKILLRDNLSVPIIILTSEDNTSLAVKAANLGAYDYHAKAHFDFEKLVTSIRNAVGFSKLQLKIKEKVNEELYNYPFIGEDSAILKIKDKIKKAAVSNEPVLITGNTGTGKEIVARHLHYNSPRSSERLIIVSLAGHDGMMAYDELFGRVRGAFTDAKESRKGKFVLADKGTLYLDDINLAQPEVQAMLLRVLEDGIIRPLGSDDENKVDVRVIASTNENLELLSNTGKFRSDLLYRLSTIKINLPPLNERPGDIPLLARFFLEKEISENKLNFRDFSKNALESMKSQPWPGNIRELRQAVKNLVILSESEVIDFEDIEDLLGIAGQENCKLDTLKGATALFQKDFISRKLSENDNNISKTATILGITRQHLQRLIRNF